MLKMKMMKPITWEANEPVRFQCKDPSCGDIVVSARIYKHANQVHATSLVDIDGDMSEWVAPDDADPLLKEIFPQPKQQTKITNYDD